MINTWSSWIDPVQVGMEVYLLVIIDGVLIPIYIYIDNNNDIWTLIHFCSRLEIRLPSYSVETENHPPRCEPVSLGVMRVSLLYCSVNKCEEIIKEFDFPLNENVMLTVAISWAPWLIREPLSILTYQFIVTRPVLHLDDTIFNEHQTFFSLFFITLFISHIFFFFSISLKVYNDMSVHGSFFYGQKHLTSSLPPKRVTSLTKGSSKF